MRIAKDIQMFTSLLVGIIDLFVYNIANIIVVGLLIAIMYHWFISLTVIVVYLILIFVIRFILQVISKRKYQTFIKKEIFFIKL